MLSTISPSVTTLAVGPPAQRAIAQRFSALALRDSMRDAGTCPKMGKTGSRFSVKP